MQFARIALISAGVLWTTVVDLGAHEGSKDWTVLENCRLIVNPANDGDSFHVSAGRNEYIFRLYLVDALETDEMTPGRLVAQAKYFGITVPQAIEVGRAAKEFTREKLSAAFTVLTHMSDAMGQSRLERFYAFVQTKEGDLGEQLVRNGLARNYGFKAVPPGLRNWRVEMEKLQRLENEARQEKIGGWGVNIGRLNAPAGAPAPFSHFGSNQKLQGTWNGYSFALVFVNTQTARTNCAWRHTQSRTSRIQKQTGHLLRSPSIQRQRKN